jgi:hypothetical protein
VKWSSLIIVINHDLKRFARLFLYQTERMRKRARKQIDRERERVCERQSVAGRGR